MSTNHYLVSAKTCTKLTQKFLIVTEQEFDNLPDKENYLVVEGPSDLLDVLVSKAERLESLVKTHVRYSVMRNGHEPIGYFNNFVDGEFYKIVERGSFSSYWRYRRSLLTEAPADKIEEFESAASENELDSVCNILYTNLSKSVYDEEWTTTKLFGRATEELVEFERTSDYLDSPDHIVIQPEIASKTEELIDRYSEQLNTVQKQLEESPIPGENGSSENEEKDQEPSKVVKKEQTEEKVVIPVIPGVRLMKLEYPVNSSQSTRDEIGLQLHHEIYNWIKSNKEIKSLLLYKNYVDVHKSKIKITLYPKDGANPIVITYTPAIDDDSYIVDIQGMILSIKTQVMIELGCIVKVPLDSVDSYDPRKQAVDVDCDHIPIPYEAKPERDMRNNMILDDKEMEPKSTTPIASVAEDNFGALLDRIKSNVDNVLALKNKQYYMNAVDVKNAIGEFNVDSETSKYLYAHIISIAKDLKICIDAETNNNISFETVQYIAECRDFIQGSTKVKFENPDRDKIALLIDALLSKEFMTKDYFKSNIGNSADDRSNFIVALKAAASYINNYHVDIVKEISKMKAIGLKDKRTHAIILALMGVPKPLLGITGTTDYNKIASIKRVFRPDSDYEYDFCNISKYIPYRDLIIKITKHYFSEKGIIPLYELLLNHYKEDITDELVIGMSVRAHTTTAYRSQKNAKAKRNKK